MPVAVRRAMGIEPGGDIVIELMDGILTLRSRATAIADIQARLKGRRRGRGSAVEEFLAERRTEAEREFAE